MFDDGKREGREGKTDQSKVSKLDDVVSVEETVTSSNVHVDKPKLSEVLHGYIERVWCICEGREGREGESKGETDRQRQRQRQRETETRIEYDLMQSEWRI